MSETVKIHIICEHVKEYLDMEGKPLGKLSEQELENSHSAFANIWARYKIKNNDSDIYLKQYLRAILYFNSLHI